MNTSTSNAPDFRINARDAHFDTPEYRAFELATGELLRSFSPTDSKGVSGFNFAIARALCELALRTSNEFLANTPDLTPRDRLAIFPKIASTLVDSVEEVAKTESILFISLQLKKMKERGEL